MVTPTIEMLLRMGTGMVLGAAIGYERERTGHPAGLRTHLLVSLASATFMLVSTQFVYFQSYGKDDLIAVDTSRIAASVVSGSVSSVPVRSCAPASVSRGLRRQRVFGWSLRSDWPLVVACTSWRQWRHWHRCLA